MAFLVQENTRFQPHIIEHNRPMLLKDFLRDDGGCKSWRSTSSKSKKPHIVLLRSWSKRAAATKMSAVHKVIKLLQFTSSKSRSVLPKRSSEGNNDIFGDVSSEVKVKVKDILRWRSFRDFVDEDPTLSPSPDRSTASASATTTTTTTTSCSKRSSWCDSDFTAEEELPPWGGENKEFWGKNAAATLKNIHKVDWSFEEYEQQSPVSVLASPFRQVEEFIVSPYHPTLANVQREKRNVRSEEQNLEREIGSNCNATEEKAKRLLRHLKEDDNDDSDDVIILDFLIEELGKFNDDDDEFDYFKILRIAKSWMDGELELEEKRESFVKDMDKGICWNNKLKQEQQHLCHQLELTLFNDLIDHLVADLISC